jgi:multidrug efflux pump
MTPPSVDGLGQSNGFTFELLASGGTDRDELLKMRNQLIGEAKKPELQAVRANLPQMPQLQVDIDSNKAVALGLSLSDVNNTLSSAWGGTYVNDFIDRGRVKKVYIQGIARFAPPVRSEKWYVRGSDDSMTPFSAFAATHWEYGPESLVRYNGSAAYEIQARTPAGSVRRGDDQNGDPRQQCPPVPPGPGAACHCRKTRQRPGHEPLCHLDLVVFLCLAALYELVRADFGHLVIPRRRWGGAGGWMRGLNNDVYFQVALLTTIGLSSKNAILIVEFAEAAVRKAIP